MRGDRNVALKLAIGALIVLSASSLGAQEEQRQPPAPVRFPAFPFNLGPPGARALGMGGAFIAIADDATASEANPAGLTILTRPEVSVHYRSTSPTIQTVDLGALSVLDGSGALISPEFFSGDTDPTFPITGDQSGISFASYVKPFDDFTFSVFYSKVTDFEASNRFQVRDEFFLDDYSTRNDLDMLLEHVGVSWAFNLSQNVALGFSVLLSTLDLNFRQEIRIDDFLDFELDFFGPGVDPALFQDISSLNRTSIDSEDTDVTFNFGLLFNPNGKLSGGVVFKDGGDYSLKQDVVDFECLSFEGIAGSSGVACDTQNLTGPDLNFFESMGDFFFEFTDLDAFRRAAPVIKMPDVFGAGLAWRPTDNFTLAADVNWITYSDLDFSDSVGSTDVFGDPLESGIEEIDDEIELHLGLEYVFPGAGGRNPISVRAGAWTDPDHDGFRAIDSETDHYTVGLGFVIKQNFQLDLAGHWSDLVDEWMLSGVYRM